MLARPPLTATHEGRQLIPAQTTDFDPCQHCTSEGTLQQLKHIADPQSTRQHSTYNTLALKTSLLPRPTNTQKLVRIQSGTRNTQNAYTDLSLPRNSELQNVALSSRH